jgi:hemerythrin
MTIGWSEELALGVTEIDNQHKELFSRFAKLAAACSEGKGKDEILKLLLFLEDYVKEHFAAEERLQLRHAYPQYATHKSEHTRFMAEVAKLASEFKAEGATLSLVIMTNKALASWLVQHIKRTDMEFAAYLRNEESA